MTRDCGAAVTVARGLTEAGNGCGRGPAAAFAAAGPPAETVTVARWDS